jgi:hypothetical protein
MGQTLNIKNSLAVTVGILLGGLSLGASASEQQELLQLKNTVVNLVDALVKQGVLDKKQAAALISKAESDAKKQAAAQIAAAPVVPIAPVPTPAETSNVGRAADGKQVVRVPYVPEFVKDEIRNQLRNEMRQDILADVSDKAKKEHWGIPDALPAWVNSVKFYGDARVRNQFDVYGSENADTLSPENLYLNVLQVNKARTLNVNDPKTFMNTSEDQNRWRERVRLGLKVKVADHWQLDTRIATGNFDNPVSSNITMGNSEQRYAVQLDRAQLRYDRTDEQGLNWLTLQAGRLPNPWFGTDLVWDDDLGFDGVAATYRYGIDFESDGFAAVPRNRNVFITGAAVPIQQPDFLSQDRWLVGGQLGLNWEFENQNLFTAGAAIYDYMHMAGKRNAYLSKLTDGTAPLFVQKGNTLFNIANGLPTDVLLGLASNYRLLDFTLSLDLANLAPYHVIFTADVVKNIAFSEEDVATRTSGSSIYLYNESKLRDRSLGALVGVQVGWPEVTQQGAWQMAFDYRYLQRDAVLDAFTESDFHLGGTDTQGYRITGFYGLTKNLWMRARWMSATEIDGPPLSIDVLQVDLNAKF